MMAQNARNHARMCPFGVKIFNVVLATGRQTAIIKIIKIKQQFITFIVRFLQQWIILGPNTKKNLIGFLVGMIFFWGGEYSPLWMPRINTDCNSQFTDVGLVVMKRGAETLYAYFQKRPTV